MSWSGGCGGGGRGRGGGDAGRMGAGDCQIYAPSWPPTQQIDHSFAIQACWFCFSTLTAKSPSSPFCVWSDIFPPCPSDNVIRRQRMYNWRCGLKDNENSLTSTWSTNKDSWDQNIGFQYQTVPLSIQQWTVSLHYGLSSWVLSSKYGVSSLMFENICLVAQVNYLYFPENVHTIEMSWK